MDVARQALLSLEFSGKNAGVGCHSLLQGTFRTQGSDPRLLRLLHWRQVLPTGRRGRLQTPPSTGYGKLRGPQQPSPGGNSTGSPQHTHLGSTVHFLLYKAKPLLDGELAGSRVGGFFVLHFILKDRDIPVRPFLLSLPDGQCRSCLTGSLPQNDKLKGS